MSEDREVRRSNRINKNQHPDHLRDYVLGSENPLRAESSENKSNSSENENDVANETVVPEENNITKVWSNITAQLKELQLQRENDNRIRVEFNKSIMHQLNDLSVSSSYNVPPDQRFNEFGTNSVSIESFHLSPNNTHCFQKKQCLQHLLFEIKHIQMHRIYQIKQ